MSKKVYFSHYGEVVSMNKSDALKLCEDALKRQGYDLMNYESSRALKKENSRESGCMRVGNKYVTVNHCLDWTEYEWESLKKDLITEEKI